MLKSLLNLWVFKNFVFLNAIFVKFPGHWTEMTRDMSIYNILKAVSVLGFA